MKFNEKLINLRKEKGLSQEEFGNILDVSRQSVSKWELGQAQPDVDKIKKICEFYDITFDYLLNDNIDEKVLLKNNDNIDENKSEIKKEDSPKNKLIIFFQIIVFIIVLAYIINSVFKAVIFSNILAKNDMDNIESYKYSSTSQKEYVFPYRDDKVLSNATVNEYICYKDDIYYVWISYDDDEENCAYWEQYWNYYNGRFDKKGYEINTKIKDAVWEQDYYYTDDGNIVIEKISNENYKYSKNIYYIDIKSGFLSKEEKFLNDEIVEKTIYGRYEINCVEDKDLMFDETLKQEIIDKSAITYEQNLRKAEKLNNEILNKNS